MTREYFKSYKRAGRLTLGVVLLIAAFAFSGSAQHKATFTGTALIYGSGFNTRTYTQNFSLTINGTTSNEEAQSYLGILQNDGQVKLRDRIQDIDLGTFSLGGRLGHRLNAVRVENVDGKLRIRAVFERWIGFGELRGGYRSVDYPFSYVELFVDPKTGKGEGTFISAASIRFRSKNGEDQVEIEDFGTFPGKLIGVTMRGRMP